MGGMGATARRTASPIRLLAQAAGGPVVMARKLVRLARALSTMADGKTIDGRLARLQQMGFVDRAPSRLQLVVGSVDMLRFWIAPAADDYYRQQGISFGFHQVLRFLDDPASVVDPLGFFSTVDVIVGHVLQVVHANPHYDLQLLESHEGGLDEMLSQTKQMLEGTHPRQASIGAVVEEADYHERLLGYIEAYLRDRTTSAPVRSNVSESEHWRELEQTFGRLDTAMRYMARLPDTPLGAARHILLQKSFPRHLGEAAQPRA